MDKSRIEDTGVNSPSRTDSGQDGIRGNCDVDTQGFGHLDGEHPEIVLADICRRPALRAKVIVFANEKGGVGKSTLAFHASIAMARAGRKVLTIDLDRRQRSLDRALENREATMRSLGVELPIPRHLVLEHQSGAMLAQEIARVGSECDTVIIDAPGHDSPIARRAIALADTLVTPVDPTFIDLDSLAHFSPATLSLLRPGSFARTVMQLRGARAERGMQPLDWALVRNRVRHSEKKQLARFNRAVKLLPDALGLRLTRDLPERVGFRELYPFGLTHADCRDLPDMAGVKINSTTDMDALLEELGILDTGQPLFSQLTNKAFRQANMPARTMARHRSALRQQLGATRRAMTSA